MRKIEVTCAKFQQDFRNFQFQLIHTSDNSLSVETNRLVEVEWDGFSKSFDQHSET